MTCKASAQVVSLFVVLYHRTRCRFQQLFAYQSKCLVCLGGLILWSNYFDFFNVSQNLSRVQIFSFTDFISSRGCPNKKVDSLMFLPHGNVLQHIFAVKRHRIHWKSFPSRNKNRSRLPKAKQHTTAQRKEVKNFLSAREKICENFPTRWCREFPSRDHLGRFSHFPSGKIVVGRRLRPLYDVFYIFYCLPPLPSSHMCAHCALDAADSRAGKG